MVYSRFARACFPECFNCRCFFFNQDVKAKGVLLKKMPGNNGNFPLNSLEKSSNIGLKDMKKTKRLQANQCFFFLEKMEGRWKIGRCKH